tara:strand:+ start:22 stop:501 length:480 start_codon:yes stop_codon:yes gene_type:complete
VRHPQSVYTTAEKSLRRTLDYRSRPLKVSASIQKNWRFIKQHRLKAAGLSIAIDDFDTDYSSLADLTRWPIDKPKIDQSFVRRLSADRQHACIVETIINKAQNLNMEVIAEGVETEREKNFLAKHNCNQYQGYLFNIAMPESEFTALRWIFKFRPTTRS